MLLDQRVKLVERLRGNEYTVDLVNDTVATLYLRERSPDSIYSYSSIARLRHFDLISIESRKSSHANLEVTLRVLARNNVILENIL